MWLKIVFWVVVPLVFYVWLDINLTIDKILDKRKKHLVILLGGPAIWMIGLIILLGRGINSIGSILNEALFEPFSRWLKTEREEE